MRRPVRFLLLALLLWNVSFLALSWWLAEKAERDHPPVGELVENTFDAFFPEKSGSER